MKNEIKDNPSLQSRDFAGADDSGAGSVGNSGVNSGETSVRARIRRYIIDDLLLATVDHVADDESLSQSGILDSTGALELVAFLEESFAIAVEDHDLTPENLDTLDGIVALVERKQAEAAVIGG